DQIIIEARDFLRAIETRAPVWPTFEDGMEVNQVIEASMVSSRSKAWVEVSSV
ncbi:MAG: gfo/Idh/MocA family oxidoreductase, partial [Marivivens sp.]|nr:gfo/Idh/MocA family oxidoreductase [Marivivens sp.]NCW70390.1 gfo/Idh/MocA family oxidoreductase [Marivivens sp.]